MSDPFHRNAATASDDDIKSIIDGGTTARRTGRAAIREEGRITDRLLGFLESDRRRQFDQQRAIVFGDDFANEIDAATANERFGVENYLKFEQPVNAHRAAEMHRQAIERRFRQEAAARAQLSTAATIGESIIGAATDPVMLPTWFIGGGSAAVRAMGATTAATRTGNIVRGAGVGMIDGFTGGVVAETLNFGTRRSTGEDYTLGDAAVNLVVGTAFGAAAGGGIGAITRPTGRAAPRRPVPGLDERVAAAAMARGLDPELAVRVRELENASGSATARPIRDGRQLSSAYGIFQITDDTWRSLGGGDRNSVTRQIELGIENLVRERNGLQRALGRDPMGWEVYLAHQQGSGGAQALLRQPQRNAIEVLTPIYERNSPGRGAARARKAVLDNGGRSDMSAGEFASLWRDKYGGAGDALPRSSMPPVLRDLSEAERVGAFAEAIEQIADDVPVDLGASLARRAADSLDEVTATPSIHGRWLEVDTAITRSGQSIPVRFGIVELDDLRTSHSDDLTPDEAYPQALQPRDRSRAGSQAANYELERDLNPDLLMKDKAAAAGAPIISPDGVVESGNGRAIALRRSANTGTEAWTRYRQALERQGYDVGEFRRPVLVRMRSEPMTGTQRAELTRAMNEAPTEAFSPVEQARADAARLDRDTLALLQGDDPFAASERPFLRGFVQRVGSNTANALTDAAGAISVAGRSRVQAALVQAAYGDDLLTAALFENADELIRTLGRALSDAAPAWARMRAEAPAAMDITPNLLSAVHTIREARLHRQSVGDFLEARIGQTDLFSGEAISPETEAMLRLMFRDEAMSKPRAADRIAAALKDYARGASNTPDGPDLFGELPDGRAFVKDLIQKYDAAEGAGTRGLAYVGGSEPLWSTRELGTAETAVLDLRQPVRDDSRPGGEKGGPQDGNEVKATAGSPVDNPIEVDTVAALEIAKSRVIAARSKVEAATQDIKKEEKIVNTRGQGVQYHGARGPITQLTEGYANDSNIYGSFETFYTTDAVDIATGYFRKNPDAVLYEVRETQPVRFFDMEEPRPVSEWKEELGHDEFINDAIDEAASEAGVDPNLRQIMDAMRGMSAGEGMTRIEIQDLLDTITYTLQQNGYGAMRHIGGLITNKRPHEVKIYLRPWEQLELRAVPIPRQSASPQAQAALDAAFSELQHAEAEFILARTQAEAAEAARLQNAQVSARIQQLIDEDTELSSLMADNEALAAGLDLEPVAARDDPVTISEAIRAAAVCLLAEAGQ